MLVMMVAYIDPGLGALIWQTVVSALVGLLFYLRKTRQAILSLFRKIFGRRQPSPAASNAAPPPKVAAQPAVLQTVLAASPGSSSAKLEAKAETR